MNDINTLVSPPRATKRPVRSGTVPITVAYGDGIGPEILAGNTAGIDPGAWESLRRTRVFYKAPITTPQGGGYKSLNVTVRKSLGLYANIRPCRSYAPFVATRHPGMDLVIVRENEEDLYAGIEHRQTDDVYQCLKLISRPGCEKINRYAFAYAQAYGRKKVTCFTKDNIMKLTDGLFHKVFREVAETYPDIENEHWIIDIGAAKLADTPEAFDVLVMPNLYGDVLSDVAAQIAGGATTLHQPEAAAVSYPTFWDDLERLGQYRRALRNVRGHPWFGAPPGGPELGQSLRPSVGRRHDAGPHRPARGRRPGA